MLRTYVRMVPIVPFSVLVEYLFCHLYPSISNYVYNRCKVVQWKIGECVIVFQFSVYMLSLLFLVNALSFSNQDPCVTNPKSILYISPMTDTKNHASIHVRCNLSIYHWHGNQSIYMSKTAHLSEVYTNLAYLALGRPNPLSLLSRKSTYPT